MKALPIALLALAVPAFAQTADIPAFTGPTPGTLRTITIPTVDFSGDTSRQVVIARGTAETYHGHCDTVLLPDGRTMFTAWTVNHARTVGPLARSDDAGLTWSAPLEVPANWHTTANTPAIHRLVDPQGKARLIVFADGLDWRRKGEPPYPMHQAVSEDDGKTWSPMAPNGIQGEVPPKTVLDFDEGKRLVLWSDLPEFVVQSESTDGGLTWSPERRILKIPARWGQPAVTRSADGKTLVMLLRENSRQHHSLYAISRDGAETWSAAQELPAALTGDRHVIKAMPDGRLVVAFRDMAKTSDTYGHYVAWVGTFDDIVHRREGQYRIKLLHNAARTPEDRPGSGNYDCGYSDLELLPDGTLVATTYVQYAAGPEKNSVVSTRFQLSETDALVDQIAAPLVPAGWDPALAGDLVMESLITVTAPQVKGAHDAEMVIVGDKAYLVAEVNDVRAGESAGWPEIYATLSIVRLDPLQLEDVIPIARGEQVFENETLPVGACFVPRILQKDAKTLRCYFTSEDPGKRQSQLWYRDFDLASGAFAPTIHRAKLKTAAGTFDFQPQHFHADAAKQGFARKAVDSSFFLFDSFKSFDGRLHVAINNFSGKQNALALVHEDLATFEILGHYNEPQSQQLSESAVNRLPDGTWMAICRNDAGNYHFTTSADGRNWSEGTERPFVMNGANSKPTFDRFGDLYHLGWQEKTRIHGVHRSVFNVDVSKDGKSWERKYRFESTKSFQYPTFREHEGVIWLCVTQGDHSESRKERIMFGRLEKVGEFASQEGKTRKPIPVPPLEEAVMKKGVKLFTDRDYALDEAPELVMGRPFLRTSIEKTDVTVTKAGTLYALTPAIRPGAASQEEPLKSAGFEKVAVEETQFFPGEINRVSLYRKEVAEGERLRFRKLVFLVMGEGTEIEDRTALAPGPWAENDGERLYNGIVLPKVWPPEHFMPDSTEPMPVPYVDHPPKVIPIDLGRQLFVDDFLIESTTLTRVHHQPKKFEGNPVFKAETERELAPSTEGEAGEEAMMFPGQGGLFWDPSEEHFKFFHVAGWRGPLSLATSPDLKTWTRRGQLLPEGLRWTGPKLVTGGSDNCVWLDLNAEDPAERIKFQTCWLHVPKERRPSGFHHSLHVSDLRTWSDAKTTDKASDDYGSFFYNPFRKKWVFSIKEGTKLGRSRFYLERDKFLDGTAWSEAVYWTAADRLDVPEPEGRYPGAGDRPQLYSLNAVAYESLLIGMHYIHRGPKNEICNAGKYPKLVDLEIGYSRDGFHWDRPDRSGFIRGSRTEGSWDRGYLHSTAGIFGVIGDELVFPYMGTSGVAPSGKRGMYSGGSIGLATLRRDGFASMDGKGALTTRPVLFSGSHLFVNLDGEVRVELLDETDTVLAESELLSGDATKERIAWKGRDGLAAFAGKPVRFRFHVGRGSLYSFWVTNDPKGASGGYLAAGGPGYAGVRDVAK